MSEQARNGKGNDGGSVTEGLPSEWVYFMYAAGRVKIGYTTDIYKRFADLRTMNGDTIELIAIIPGNKSFEKTLHRMFKADRSHGEWFNLSSEIRRFLSCLDDAVGALFPPEALPEVGSCLARLERAETKT